MDQIESRFKSNGRVRVAFYGVVVVPQKLPRPDKTTPTHLLVRQQPLDGEKNLAQRLVVVGPVHRAVAGAVLEMCVRVWGLV